MEQFSKYINPELLVLIPVLFFIGKGIKKSQINDKYIPFIVSVFGIALATLYGVSVCVIDDYRSISMCIFTAIIQGILVSGSSVYADQLYKQTKKVN